jgi:hypothetical protein
MVFKGCVGVNKKVTFNLDRGCVLCVQVDQRAALNLNHDYD